MEANQLMMGDTSHQDLDLQLPLTTMVVIFNFILICVLLFTPYIVEVYCSVNL